MERLLTVKFLHPSQLYPQVGTTCGYQADTLSASLAEQRNSWADVVLPFLPFIIFAF